MPGFDSLRRKLHQRLLSQHLRQHPYPRHSVNFGQAQRIGILFDATELPTRDIVLSFVEKLRKTGKSVKALGFVDTRAELENFTFGAFNRKNLDWLKRPSGEAVADFLHQQFDILLNLSMKENPALEYIAALSKAHYRVGAFSNTIHCYELMIDLPASHKLPDLIVQIEFFLQKMQPTHGSAKI